ncbi:MAG: sugar phosphate isomerase/epimerase [Planctomycetota bacterium]
MKLAMWTGYLWELNPEESVREFAARGWKWLELSEEHAHELLRRGDPTKTGEALRKFAADRGVRIAQGHFIMTRDGAPGVDIVEQACADEKLFHEQLERLARWVELFAATGIEAGVYHAGGKELRKLGWSADRILARRLAGVERMRDHAKGTRVRICLENLEEIGATYEAMRPLVEPFREEEVGVCLDTGHANMGGGDCAEFVRRAGKRLRALHVHDSIGSDNDHVLPYSRGTINWKTFLAALRETRYEGVWSWELPGETMWCPLDVRLMKLDYVRRLGEWMVEKG